MNRPTTTINHARVLCADDRGIRDLVQWIDHLEAIQIREVFAYEVEVGQEVWDGDSDCWRVITHHDRNLADLYTERRQPWISYQQGCKLIVRAAPKSAIDPRVELVVDWMSCDPSGDNVADAEVLLKRLDKAKQA